MTYIDNSESKLLHFDVTTIYIYEYDIIMLILYSYGSAILMRFIFNNVVPPKSVLLEFEKIHSLYLLIASSDYLYYKM